jgi:hypothetical protein
LTLRFRFRGAGALDRRDGVSRIYDVLVLAQDDIETDRFTLFARSALFAPFALFELVPISMRFQRRYSRFLTGHNVVFA